MNRFGKFPIIFVLLLFALGLPAFSCAHQLDDAGVYYPLVAGNTWTYQFSDNKSTARYEVIGYLDDCDAWLVKCTTNMIDVSITTELVMGNKGGRIVHFGGTDIKAGKSRLIYDNGEVILKAPLKVGMSWEYDKDNRDNDMVCRVKCRVVKITDCEVLAGRFENVCMIQRTTCYYKSKTEKNRKVQNEYYAPRVGEIKEESVDALGKANVLMELLEYKIQ